MTNLETEMAKKCILVVDDMPEIVDILDQILSPQYNVKVAHNGVEALDVCHNCSTLPDLILLDAIMPEMGGYEVCRLLKQDRRFARIPIIFLTVLDQPVDEAKGLSLGAVDFITKPFSSAVVLARIRSHIELHNRAALLEDLVELRTKELNETRLQIIQRLCKAVEFKDKETASHIICMSLYCKEIALAAGMSEIEGEQFLNAAPMHDVGKIGVSDSVLLKPGPLDEEEWKMIKKHCEIGAEIIGISEKDPLRLARIIALTHHEKWNGSGYPNGLKAEDIPLVGRIAAIADVFDALTSIRPYKEAWSVEEAVAFIKSESGRYFDPQLVEAFLRALPKMVEIRNHFSCE